MRKLFYLFMVAMCATMFTACSDDDDKDPLDDDGEGKEGVITMTTEETYIHLYVATFNEGDIITIDWGDGDPEEFKSFKVYQDWDEDGEDEIHYVLSTYDIEHEYSNKNPHIVTIKGNIKRLNCVYNNLTSLNVSGCTALTYLDCSPNNLTSLDVSKNTALTYLSCGYNNLTSLDVSKNTKLTELDCSHNDLTSLDVSKNTALTYLDCSGNNLTSLDVSKNTALTRLDCSGNNLTSAALNQIFRDLPQVTSRTIYMSGNPGTETCDKSIAENKGWKVK